MNFVGFLLLLFEMSCFFLSSPYMECAKGTNCMCGEVFGFRMGLDMCVAECRRPIPFSSTQTSKPNSFFFLALSSVFFSYSLVFVSVYPI